MLGMSSSLLQLQQRHSVMALFYLDIKLEDAWLFLKYELFLLGNREG